MPKDQEWHELNDRVTRLAARVTALDGLQENVAQPAVLEVEASTVVAEHAAEQIGMRRRRETAETQRRGEVWVCSGEVGRTKLRCAVAEGESGEKRESARRGVGVHPKGTKAQRGREEMMEPPMNGSAALSTGSDERRWEVGQTPMNARGEAAAGEVAQSSGFT